MLNARRAPAQRQRGLSIVEMMVGVAIGLIVVAAAALLVSAQLGENRRLLIETQIQQDLRATADIMTRELRRAGYSNLAPSSVWYRGTPGVVKNLLTAVSPTATPQSEVTYQYFRNGSESSFGFKLEDGVIKTLIGGEWQQLTDANTLKVTALTITPNTAPAAPTRLPCPKLCADGTQNCWPTIQVRDLIVDITAQAANDASVTRSIRSAVRLRNDWVRFNDAAHATLICPA